LLQELDVAELWRSRQRKLVVQPVDAADALPVLIAAGHTAAMRDNGLIELSDTAAVDHSDQIARLLVEAGYPPRQLRIEEEDLEQYFLRLVGKDGGAHHE
jgi:ABC-2 type transport system ATP-binding protein